MIELHNINRTEIMSSVAGGTILTLATTLFFLLFGTRLQIISSLKALLNLQFDASGFKKLTILAGFTFSSALARSLYHEHIIKFWPFDSNEYISQNVPLILIISGFLSGIGSTLGNGCILTHIICGIPLFKWKSFLAVILLMGAAYYTHEIKLGQTILSTISVNPEIDLPSNIDGEFYLLPCLTVPFIGFIISKGKSLRDLSQYMLIFFIGFLIGLAVMIGGLVSQKKMLTFFEFTNPLWNPKIAIVFGTAILMNLIFFTIIRKNKAPLLSDHFDYDDGRFSVCNLMGPVIFGIGWGLTGITIETMLTFVVVRSTNLIFYWGVSCLVGVKVGSLIMGLGQKIGSKSKK